MSVTAVCKAALTGRIHCIRELREVLDSKAADNGDTTSKRQSLGTQRHRTVYSTYKKPRRKTNSKGIFFLFESWSLAI